jgi:hypothetical protein
MYAPFSAMKRSTNVSRLMKRMAARFKTPTAFNPKKQKTLRHQAMPKPEATIVPLAKT